MINLSLSYSINIDFVAGFIGTTISKIVLIKIKISSILEAP